MVTDLHSHQQCVTIPLALYVLAGNLIFATLVGEKDQDFIWSYYANT